MKKHDLLKKIVEERLCRTSLTGGEILEGKITQAQVLEVKQAITDELCAKGIDEYGEINSYGIMLDDLLDEIRSVL